MWSEYYATMTLLLSWVQAHLKRPLLTAYQEQFCSAAKETSNHLPHSTTWKGIWCKMCIGSLKKVLQCGVYK